MLRRQRHGSAPSPNEYRGSWSGTIRCEARAPRHFSASPPVLKPLRAPVSFKLLWPRSTMLRMRQCGFWVDFRVATGTVLEWRLI